MYLPRLIKSRARRGQEGSAAHTRVRAGNLRSPRAGRRRGTEEVRVTRQRVSGPGFYVHGRSRRGGSAAEEVRCSPLGRGWQAEDVPPAVRDHREQRGTGEPPAAGHSQLGANSCLLSSRAAGSDARISANLSAMEGGSLGSPRDCRVLPGSSQGRDATHSLFATVGRADSCSQCLNSN